MATLSIDERTPVIIGVGQVDQRPADPNDSVEPFRLMVRAVAAAMADSGSDRVSSAIDLVAVVRGAWSYTDPGRLIADELDLGRASTAITSMGGQAPQFALNIIFERIQRGDLEAAIVTGGETIWSRRKLRALGEKMSTTTQVDTAPDEVLGTELTMSTPFEEQRGIDQPAVLYSIFESAIRAANGESIAAHRKRLGKLWAGFNRTAVGNKHAWIRDPMTATEIITPSVSNRMVGFPYTKAMNSNWFLDQAGAVFVASARTATRLGVERDKWVFPWAGASANDTAAVTNRRDLHSSPAIAAIADSLFAYTQLASDEIDHIDLYSCFPSAVQIAAAEFGLSLDRQLTVTGGLTFAGGPLNNYVTHSVAAMTEALRSRPGTGLVTANGGYITKHSATIYRSDPPPEPFTNLDAQTDADRVPGRLADESFTGVAHVEGYTVMHSRSGPPVALAAVTTPTGGRTWGRADDADTVAELMAVEGVGRAIHLDSHGAIKIID